MDTSYQKRHINSGNTLIILENSFRINKKEAALASFNVRAASLYYSLTISHY